MGAFLGVAASLQPVLSHRSSCVVSQPSSARIVTDQHAAVSRRDVASSFAAAALLSLGAQPAHAKEEDPFKLKKDYPTDAKNMLTNMRTATELQRGNPEMETIVKATRSEMNDFVAFYRRQPKVSGMPSFSTLYTATNTRFRRKGGRVWHNSTKKLSVHLLVASECLRQRLAWVCPRCFLRLRLFPGLFGSIAQIRFLREGMPL